MGLRGLSKTGAPCENSQISFLGLSVEQFESESSFSLFCFILSNFSQSNNLCSVNCGHVISFFVF